MSASTPGDAGARGSIRVALAALLASIVLLLFFEACGTIHGAPACGPLSYAAIPFVVVALAIDSALFAAPSNDAVIRFELWIVAFVVALMLLAAIGRATRRPGAR